MFFMWLWESYPGCPISRLIRSWQMNGERGFIGEHFVYYRDGGVAGKKLIKIRFKLENESP